MAKATLEGISYELSLALDVLASKIPLSDTLLAVGGGAKSNIWLQIYADILNKNILHSSIARDAASLGAAALAFSGAGIWTDYRKIKEKHLEGTKIESKSENVEFYRKQKKTFNLVCRQMADLSATYHTI
jgi:xylulokinase